MTDNDRNTRTLILCFVIAIMVLVPLRFVEEGNIVQVQNQQVLGETIEVAVPTPVINNDAKLEEPYNQIDGPTVVR